MAGKAGEHHYEPNSFDFLVNWSDESSDSCAVVTCNLVEVKLLELSSYQTGLVKIIFLFERMLLRWFTTEERSLERLEAYLDHLDE